MSDSSSRGAACGAQAWTALRMRHVTGRRSRSLALVTDRVAGRRECRVTELASRAAWQQSRRSSQRTGQCGEAGGRTWSQTDACSVPQSLLSHAPAVALATICMHGVPASGSGGAQQAQRPSRRCNCEELNGPSKPKRHWQDDQWRKPQQHGQGMAQCAAAHALAAQRVSTSASGCKQRVYI